MRTNVRHTSIIAPHKAQKINVSFLFNNRENHDMCGETEPHNGLLIRQIFMSMCWERRWSSLRSSFKSRRIKRFCSFWSWRWDGRILLSAKLLNEALSWPLSLHLISLQAPTESFWSDSDSNFSRNFFFPYGLKWADICIISLIYIFNCSLLLFVSLWSKRSTRKSGTKKWFPGWCHWCIYK